MERAQRPEQRVELIINQFIIIKMSRIVKYQKFVAVVAVVGLLLRMSSAPLNAQDMASVEMPVGPSVTFAYGIDYHDKWYTRLCPTFAYSMGSNIITGKWHGLQYSFGVEQRYYYNMAKRQSKEKRTMLKSANYVGVKPTYIYQHYINEYMLDETSFACPVFWGMRRAMNHRFYFDVNVGIYPEYSALRKGWASSGFASACVGYRLF